MQQNQHFVSDTVTVICLVILCGLAFFAFNFLLLLSKWFGPTVWFIIIPSLLLLLLTSLHLIRGDGMSKIFVKINDKEDFTLRVGKIAKGYGYKLMYNRENIMRFKIPSVTEGISNEEREFEVRMEKNIGIIVGPRFLMEHIEDNVYLYNYESFKLLSTG
jgi:hypothetical protein